MIQKKSLLLALLTLLTTPLLQAASVTQIKGQQVLIDLEGAEINEGDEFFLINPETEKKSAIIRIKKTKGSKAIGEILKGKGQEGYTLLAKGSSPKTADTAEAAPAESKSSPRTDGGFLRSLKDSYGITGSLLMNTMNADVSYSNGSTTLKSSASMSGTGFGVGGFYDYVLGPDLVARGFAGLEQFSATGSAALAACSGSTNCDAKINYLSLYGLGKWYLTQNKMRTWLGGGAGYLLAMSKSSSALNESQISTNSVFTAAVGIDYQSDRKNYIPVSIEYNMFPASDTVKASQIIIKAGWAWNL